MIHVFIAAALSGMGARVETPLPFPSPVVIYGHAYRDVGGRAASGTSGRGGRAASGIGRRGSSNSPPLEGCPPGRGGRAASGTSSRGNRAEAVNGRRVLMNGAFGCRSFDLHSCPRRHSGEGRNPGNGAEAANRRRVLKDGAFGRYSFGCHSRSAGMDYLNHWIPRRPVPDAALPPASMQASLRWNDGEGGNDNEDCRDVSISLQLSQS